MAYQGKFFKGEMKTHQGREDKLRGNPEAPPMHGGPGDLDADIPDGADAPKKGSSQPKAKAKDSDELPLKSQVQQHKRMHMILMAQALRKGQGEY